MARNKYGKLLRTVAVTGCAFLINYLIQLLLTPYITNHVGIEAYGFVTLAKNFAQYAMIITMALNSFASRHIAVAYHDGNKKTANEFFSSTYYGDGMLACGLLIIALTVILFLEQVLRIPEGIVTDVKLLFLFVFLNFWLITLFTVYEAAAYIENRLDLVGAFKGLSYLVEAVVLICLYLFFPPNVYYVGIGLIAASLVVVTGNRWISGKYTPDLKVNRQDFSWRAVKRLVIDGVWTSVNSLGELLNNGLDLFVSNLMLTPLHMGQLAIAKTTHSMLYGLFVIINPAFQPMFLKSYAEKKSEELLVELKTAMKVSGMLANVAFAGFAALGLCFYQLWIPQENTRLIYELTVINCLTLIPSGPMNPLYYIYTLTLKKKFPCLVTVAGGVCNVIGMYVLIRYTSLGVKSVVWTTVAVMMVIDFITNPLYMAHVLHMPLRTFYPQIIRNVIACGVLTLTFRGLSALYMPSSWPGLAACAVIYALVGAALHLLIVFDRNDWKHALRFIKKEGK